MNPALNLPSFKHRIKSVRQSTQIFDLLRRKYVALTPEEWVRQHFINFLITEKKYPSGLFAVEKGHKLHELQKRTDLVIYDLNLNPWMIVEFKSYDIEIDQEVFYQVARYNLTLGVNYLVVTNGMEHFCCKRIDDKFEFLDDLPEHGL